MSDSEEYNEMYEEIEKLRIVKGKSSQYNNDNKINFNNCILDNGAYIEKETGIIKGYESCINIYETLERCRKIEKVKYNRLNYFNNITYANYKYGEIMETFFKLQTLKHGNKKNIKPCYLIECINQFINNKPPNILLEQSQRFMNYKDYFMYIYFDVVTQYETNFLNQRQKIYSINQTLKSTIQARKFEYFNKIKTSKNPKNKTKI